MSSSAAILTLGVAIATSLAYSPSATAGPNYWLADLRVNTIGEIQSSNGHRCPTDQGSTLTYQVEFENVRDDGTHQARVYFTTGSNQVVDGYWVDASFEMDPEDEPECDVFTTPNGAQRVVYCDIPRWDTMGETMTFDFVVTTTADDLHVAAWVNSFVPEGGSGGVSLMGNNYLEHAYDSTCN